MLLAIDFDGTVVDRGGSYSDLAAPLRLMPGAKAGLRALKKAGHVLLLYSARANRALREDPQLDPMVRAGVRTVHRRAWTEDRELNQARYQQMIEFVSKELPGVFDAIDDGVQGKPIVDLFIDDAAVRLGQGPTAVDWVKIAGMYGEPSYAGGE